MNSKGRYWDLFILDASPPTKNLSSLAVGDLDGDGEPEIVCGEHDPFKPYRSRCRLFVYKRVEPQGRAWFRYTLDDRFEHHDGTKIFEVAPGRMGIISHGWTDSRYVHLWEAY
ncbi:FG-GAP repeat protein [Candidatus Aerophobetes bacterium]|nr:FG-GAP repeat protein [Candidatus Aerophobetes bacterium]